MSLLDICIRMQAHEDNAYSWPDFRFLEEWVHCRDSVFTERKKKKEGKKKKCRKESEHRV